MMGVLMARVGRKRRLAVEAEYWRLLQSGVGTVEECRQLGIGRKTGYRWRSENGGLPPERVPEAVHSGRYLSLLERKRIATLREHGLGIREIAERLGRSPSTVSQELRRNTLEHDKGVYNADLAHHRSRQRAERPRRPKLRLDADLRAEVRAKLDLEWSPEQIAADLRALWPDRTERHLCHETIYRALYQGGKGAPSRTLTKSSGAAGPCANSAARPTGAAIRRSGDTEPFQSAHRSGDGAAASAGTTGRNHAGPGCRQRQARPHPAERQLK